MEIERSTDKATPSTETSPELGSMATLFFKQMGQVTLEGNASATDMHKWVRFDVLGALEKFKMLPRRQIASHDPISHLRLSQGMPYDIASRTLGTPPSGLCALCLCRTFCNGAYSANGGNSIYPAQVSS
jgi:hypothetical protein